MIASLSRGSLEDVIHEQQQLSTYVSWVNCQLRKRPGLRPVTDLRRDLQDGVVLAHLIHIVAGEVLEGVHLAPRDPEERRQNVERVLQFITSKHIRMPNTSARDIVDGNLKSVMRMILALAAHFKPSANHRAASGSGRGSGRSSANHSPLSTIALAQGAATVLATARHDASQPARHTRLHSLSSTSLLSSPRALPSSQSQHRHQQEDNRERSQLASESVWDNCLSETLEKEMQETHRMMSALQALLLNGSLPEEEQETCLILDDCNAHQQVVVLRSHLDQSMEENQALKRELQRCKEDLRTLHGAKEAQQRRLCVQEASVLQLRQELLRASMDQEQLHTHNVELQVSSMKNSMDCTEKGLYTSTASLAELQRKLEECTRLWSECKKELEHKSSLLQELMVQNLHQISTNSQNNGFSHSGNPSSSLSGGEELQLVKESVRSLRSSFRDQDPQQHTLDTLEQGIASLTDRLQALQPYRGRGKSPGHKASSTDSCTKESHSTKVLYFTGPSATPSMIHIPKRLGEVTLRDIKAAVDREGGYRYHFKALDPEFGTVKEEVFLDGAVVPGWEGKIVAWLEKDHEERPEMGDAEDPAVTRSPGRQRAADYSERRMWTEGRVDPL